MFQSLSSLPIGLTSHSKNVGELFGILTIGLVTFHHQDEKNCRTMSYHWTARADFLRVI